VNTNDQNKEGTVFCIDCPCCGTGLWIDAKTHAVMKTEKRHRPKSSFDDLLMKEKKKKEEADVRFLSSAELEKEKKREAKKKFEAALSNLDWEE
jgi:uncharacterized Zn finger protein (UPF0148 family)